MSFLLRHLAPNTSSHPHHNNNMATTSGKIRTPEEAGTFILFVLSVLSVLQPLLLCGTFPLHLPPTSRESVILTLFFFYCE